jgi:hypothetical protein
MHGVRKPIDEARFEAYALPLKDIDVSRPELFHSNTIWPYFERLRREDPIHCCPQSRVGPYWSVTKYKDIMHVETNHRIFSSDINIGGIGIQDTKPENRREMFIAMDEPRHSQQRKTVAPMFQPQNLDQLANVVRVRACEILDHLPRNETFDWVDRVSVELTTLQDANCSTGFKRSCHVKSHCNGSNEKATPTSRSASGTAISTGPSRPRFTKNSRHSGADLMPPPLNEPRAS